MVLVCESQHFIVHLKVEAIGQEGHQNLLDSDWHPPGLEERPQLSPAFIYPSELVNLAYFVCQFISFMRLLWSYCLFFLRFFCNYYVNMICLFSDLFCKLVESWKVLWKLFWSLFLLTWCIWLCPCACLCCSWCVVSVHSCIFLWLSVQCSFLSISLFPSVTEGHQMTDFRVYTIKESTRVLGTRGTAHAQYVV